MSTERISELSADKLEPSVTRFLEQVSPMNMLKVTLPSGGIAVVMSGADFESHVATSEISATRNGWKPSGALLPSLANEGAMVFTGVGRIRALDQQRRRGLPTIVSLIRYIRELPLDKKSVAKSAKARFGGI